MAGRLLIVDDVATNRIVLKVKLANACYDTLLAEDGAAALRIARAERPDLVLLDLCLPDIGGLEVMARLRADPATRDIPVIAVTAQTDTATRIAALRAGVEDVLHKPVDDLMLLARIRSILRARDSGPAVDPAVPAASAAGADLVGLAEADAAFDRPGRIALIAATRTEADAWQGRLSPHLPDRFVILTREQALAAAGGGRAPDIFVIATDARAPGDGLRLISDLRSRAGTHRAAICLALPGADRDRAAMALDLGANDLLLQEAPVEEIALRLRARMRAKHRADRQRAALDRQLRLAVKDPLTGLHNRRYALPQMARIAAEAQSRGTGFAVLVLDLDRFKAVNDTHGHAAGDAVLIEVAARLRRELRAQDLLARFGGEEFLAVLPDATPAGAREVAERLCRAIEARPIPLPGRAERLRITVSIGLALGCGAVPDDRARAWPEAVLDRADHALLAAKAAGRNQVTEGTCAA